MALWVPNFKRYPITGRNGFSYDRLDPKKLLLHSTEGSTISGAIAAYRPYPPHVICDYHTRLIIQHISLERAAYSLKGTDNDDEPCIQVEIVGYSHAAPNWSSSMLDWLVDEVFIPIYNLWPFQIKGPPQGFVSYLDAQRRGINLSSPYSPIRFKKHEFESFGGICAHQHVPYPDTHWDVPINIDYVVNRMRSWEENMHTELAALRELAVRSHPYVVVEACYWAVFARDPDPGGLIYWADRLKKDNFNAVDLIANLKRSPEYKP